MNAQPPLTPEERALANALQRLGPPAQPPPALDARILAMAREGAVVAPVTPAPSARTAARAPHRWPMALGVAASMVLAVGIAWRMSPATQSRHSAATVSDSAVAPAMPAGETMASADDAVAAEMAASPEPPAPPAPAAAIASDTTPQRAAKARMEQASPAPQAFPAERASAGAVAELPQSAAADIAISPAAQAAPPAPAAVARTPQAQEPRDAAVAIGAGIATQPPAKRDAGLERAIVTGSPLPTADDAPAAAAATAETEARRAAADEDLSGFTVEEINQHPPTNADAPPVQKAWLQRIRDLAAQGHTEAARLSLQEFQRRYPRYPLPQDLQALQSP